MNLQIPEIHLYVDLSEESYGEVLVDKSTVYIRVTFRGYYFILSVYCAVVLLTCFVKFSCVCMCGFCNVWVCVGVGFVMCGFVMCGCVCVWVL